MMRLNVLFLLLLALIATTSIVECLSEECDANVDECEAVTAAETGTGAAVGKKSSSVSAKQKQGAVLKYPIQHALGDNQEENDGFVNRGEIEVAVSKKTKKISIKFSAKAYELSTSELTRFKELVHSDGFYRIRVPTTPTSLQGPWLYASVRACLLVENGFKESFRFHLDKSGKLVSIELQPLNDMSVCSASGKDIVVPEIITIRSKASAALPRDAHIAKPEILSQANLKKSNLPAELQQDLGSGGINTKGGDSEGEKEGQEEGQTSFLRKYWYIFLPLFLASFAGGPPQEGQGGKKK